MARLICNIITAVGVGLVVVSLVPLLNIPLFSERTCVQDPKTLAYHCGEMQ